MDILRVALEETFGEAVARRRLLRMRGAAGLLDTIGHTPLVDVSGLLDRTRTAPGVRLLAKLEGCNPTGSVKDRVALSMVRTALDDGSLMPGQGIIEPTSGNTGIALALVGRLMGHPIQAVMPDNATPERVQLLEAFGARVTFSPGALGSNGAVDLATRMAQHDPTLYLPMQYENPANPQAHYDGTGLELLEQVDGPIHSFVAGLGTGGTLTGVARRLREEQPDVRIIAAEPHAGDAVMGLRSLEEGYVPPVLDPTCIDLRVLISNRHSVLGTRALAEVGVFAGISSGACAQVARLACMRAPAGATIVMLVADTGWRYLSARLYERDLDDLEQHMDAGHWW